MASAQGGWEFGCVGIAAYSALHRETKRAKSQEYSRVYNHFRLLDLMFIYRPSKDMCWGHALRPKDTGWRIAKQRLESFLDMYFEMVERNEDSKFIVRWKDSVLPNIAWPAEFLAPDQQKQREILFLFLGERVGFPLGLTIPISPQESSSYEFLGRFSASAPFKMSPKHFSVVVRSGKKGTLVGRKPAADIVAHLQAVIV